MFGSLLERVLSVTDTTQKAAYETSIRSLSEYFEAQKEIRCFVTNTNGFGHQVSTINIMLRLIGYGYKGAVSLIYDDGKADKPTIEKLALLLPEIKLKTGGVPPDPIAINNATVSFFPVSSYQPSTSVDFGFTGGFDDKSNLAEKYKTTYFLVLQPFQWGKSYWGNILFVENGAKCLNLDRSTDMLPYFKDRAFFLPDPTLSDATWDLYLDTVSGADSANLIHSFATNTDPEDIKINLCSAYGMTDAFNGLNTLATTAPNLLFNLTCGIIQFLDSAAYTLRVPTVLLVMADVLKESYAKLQNYIQGTDIDDNANTISFLTQHDVKNRVHFQLDGWDCDKLLKAIDSLENNHVLIVSLPGLPPPIFNQMMYAANIPMVFEGKNTANLAINFSNSFFWLATSGSGVVYPTLPLGSATGAIPRVNQYNANTMQLGPKYWPSLDRTPKNPAQVLGGFINDSYPTNPTDFTRYFTNLAQFYHDELNDKLFIALQAFLNIKS